MLKYGFLNNNPSCEKCGRNCRLIERKNKKDGLMWICTGGTLCRAEFSIRKGSFFSRMKMPLKQCFKFLYLWNRGHKLKDLMHETDIKGKTAVDYASFCRDVCV